MHGNCDGNSLTFATGKVILHGWICPGSLYPILPFPNFQEFDSIPQRSEATEKDLHSKSSPTKKAVVTYIYIYIHMHIHMAHMYI